MKKVDLETYAKALEASDDYRVLRRLGPLVPHPDALAAALEGGPFHPGVYVDVESTGLDTDVDEVIELAIYPFTFTKDGHIIEFGEPLHRYHQPKEPIKELITKLTGITNEMVAGKKIVEEEVFEFMKGKHLAVAHHADFDRKMLERVSERSFKNLCWGCSMSQVPWADFGIEGRKLGYVLAGLGRFYKAHNATTDCQAGLYALQAVLPSGKTVLAHVLDAGRASTYHVWACNAPFNFSDGFRPGDAMKARGYFWNPGDDGRSKAWHKEIGEADKDAEETWLARTVYRATMSKARFDPVTAYNRFSKRG